MDPIIKLYPMTTAADCAAYTELSQQAFRKGLMAAMYPASKGGFSTSARVDLCRSVLNEIQGEGGSSRTKLFKAVDLALEASGCDPLNGIVGIAKWVFYPSRSAETVDRELEEAVNDVVLAGADDQFIRVWRRCIGTAKNDVMGKEAWIYLSLLVTREGFQRKGIGKQMMAWGLREADENQLPVYLEASPAGQPLYEKSGFVARGRLPFDATPWTDTDALEHVLMVRSKRKPVYTNGSVVCDK